MRKTADELIVDNNLQKLTLGNPREEKQSLRRRAVFADLQASIYEGKKGSSRSPTSPTALTLFPRTNIPMGIPLRLGQLRTLWPDGPVFTTLYSPGPPRRNGASGSCMTASWGQGELGSLKKSSALDLDSWKFWNTTKQKTKKNQNNLLIMPL